MKRGFLIVLILMYVACEDTIINEYYVIDTDTYKELDTGTDTDCLFADICNVVADATCMVKPNDTWFIRETVGCTCRDGLQTVVYREQVCADGCVSNSNGIDWCVGYGPED